MATTIEPYVKSETDGEEAGGFIVMNLAAMMNDPYQVVEEESGGHFSSLNEARIACRRWREESGNPEIYVYALVGVRDALDAHPGEFTLIR